MDQQACREQLLVLEGLAAWTELSLDGITRVHRISSGRLPGWGAHHPRPPKGVRMVMSPDLGSSHRGRDRTLGVLRRLHAFFRAIAACGFCRFADDYAGLQADLMAGATAQSGLVTDQVGFFSIDLALPSTNA